MRYYCIEGWLAQLVGSGELAMSNEQLRKPCPLSVLYCYLLFAHLPDPAASPG